MVSQSFFDVLAQIEGLDRDAVMPELEVQLHVAHSAPTAVPRRAWLGPLCLATLGTSAWAWWQFAWPVVTLKALTRHADHFGLVYAHMVGGTLMLAAGATALYIGWTRRAFQYHTWVGYTYLLGGGAGAALGLALSLGNAHGISGVTVATGTLAVVWLAVAAMAFRAARNRRFDAHRQWMIRSYVLTWTFVGCRLTGRVPALEALGDAGGAAIVWLSWVVPLLICEGVLQWASTSPVKRLPGRSR